MCRGSRHGCFRRRSSEFELPVTGSVAIGRPPESDNWFSCTPPDAGSVSIRQLQGARAGGGCRIGVGLVTEDASFPED